jgi:DNA repair protein RecO
MLTRTQGIVIKRIPYTDNSAVVHIYTKENGLVPFLLQGLGKPKSKVAYYQIGQLLEINYNHKSSGGLNRIREVSLLGGYQLPIEFHKQQLLFFFIEVIHHSVEEAHADHDFFEFLMQQFLNLQKNMNLSWAPITFLMGISKELGYGASEHMLFPHDEDLRKVLCKLKTGKLPESNKNERRIILNRLIKHLQSDIFMGKTLKSVEILQELND